MSFNRRKTLFRFTAALALVALTASCASRFIPISLERRVGFEPKERVRIRLVEGGDVVVKGFWVGSDSLGGEVVNPLLNSPVASRTMGEQISFHLDQVRELEHRETHYKPALIILLGITAAVFIGASSRKTRDVYKPNP